MKSPTRLERFAVMTSLVLGGESIYTLPYFLRRDYANTMSEALRVSPSELGTLNTVFGVVALLCYFPGGWLADRVPTRWLLTGSLVATGAGGLWFATLPGYTAALAVYAFWGVTTILTFWAALVKAVRMWGGDDAQGRAFGFLDGGRALFGAVFGTIALSVFGAAATEVAGLRAVIVFYSCLSFLCAGMTWAFLPSAGSVRIAEAAPPTLAVLRLPKVWLHAAVIFCAYSAYWGTYNLAGYASDGFALDAKKRPPSASLALGSVPRQPSLRVFLRTALGRSAL